MLLKPTLIVCAFLATQTVCAQDVRIGVLGLFHPKQVTLHVVDTQALVVQTGAGREQFVLERSTGRSAATISSSGDGLTIRLGDRLVQATELRGTGRNGGAIDFALAIPSKISRRYHGVIEVRAAAGILIPVVTMDLETAVASAVQAESDSDAPPEELKAQAVATRSYFVAARGRHHSFDFCDTTHCQFLREPPSPEGGAYRAARATHGLVLAYRQQTIAAMFTRSCGGRTRSPEEVGMPHQAYPYFAVVCNYCQQNPWRWARRVTQSEASDLEKRGEAARLDIDRSRGWDVVPSNNFAVLRSEGDGVILNGAGQGHGIGLCQRGAKAMAAAGSGFHQILEHYYPNTTLIRLDRPAGPIREQHSSTKVLP
jgi:stage II sporulation protein D